MGEKHKNTKCFVIKTLISGYDWGRTLKE